MVDPELGAEVDALLAAAGIAPSAAEREELVALYENLRPTVDALYAVEEARYESSALVFRTRPELGTWGASDG